jgi:hypothetical protein
VWGGGNVSESVHEDTKWYRIIVEGVIFFFITNTIYYYLNYHRLINCIYIGIVL